MRPVAGLLLLALGAAPAAAIELPARENLRVCADPNLLPFSNQAAEGFENEIAELIAAELGVPVVYFFYPQTMGFVRNTLAARNCDLVMGAASGEPLMQNTNPYYRSVYTMVYRADSGLTATTLADPALREKRFGVMIQTPPATLLAHYGLTNIQPYQLATDTRANQPMREAIEDLSTGAIDVALLWGPFAGYFASQSPVPLTVAPLLEEPPGIRLDFNISMGLRIDEPEWKHWLNDFITANQDAINRILHDYHVPLLDAQGQLIAPD